jgi:hypothetical protein
MKRFYLKKIETETGKAIRIIKSWGMRPVRLQYTFGGDASEWGRILKGQHQPHGEYLAICKEINLRRYDATTTWEAAKKKYGKRTRNGGIVPRTRNVLNDVWQYYEQQMFEDRQRGVYFDPDTGDPANDYYNAMDDFYNEGPHFPEEYKEVQNARRDFLSSLKV